MAELVGFNCSAAAVIAATPPIEDISPTRAGPSGAVAACAAYNCEAAAGFVAHAPQTMSVVTTLSSSAQMGSTNETIADIATKFDVTWQLRSPTQALAVCLVIAPSSDKASKGMEARLMSQRIAESLKLFLHDTAFPIIDAFSLNNSLECSTKLSSGITSPFTNFTSSAKFSPATPMLPAVSFGIGPEVTFTAMRWDALIMIVVLNLSISMEVAKDHLAHFLVVCVRKWAFILLPTFMIRWLLALSCRGFYRLRSTLSAMHAIKSAVPCNSSTISADHAIKITEQLCSRQSALEVTSDDVFTERGSALLVLVPEPVHNWRILIEIVAFVRAETGETKLTAENGVMEIEFRSTRELSELRKRLKKVEASSVKMLM